jgi:AraC family L-rhamnose operon regulatory protein RhaS
MAERADAFHKLIYVFAGEIEFRAADDPQPRIVQTGNVLVVPAAERHAIVDRRPSTLLLLCLAPGFLGRDRDLAKLWTKLATTSARPLSLDRPGRLRLEALWRRGLLEQMQEGVGAAAAGRALATQILVLLARLPARDPGGDAAQRVAGVAREVGETIYDDWNLDRAAARAGLSRRRFSELFRTARGATFWDFLTDLRLKHAAEMLEAGEHSVTGVMFACGFNDVSNFYRLFRRRFGHPPKTWARAPRRQSNG